MTEKRFYTKNNLDFKKKISTTHAVISLIENIEKTIDNKMFVESFLICKKHLIL